MSYVNKNIQTLINHTDACGQGGMKKAGLVYGSDWARLNSNTLKTHTPHTFHIVLPVALAATSNYSCIFS